MRFKEHVAITGASTTAVGDHIKLSGHTLDMSSSSILATEEDMFERRNRGAIEIFCQRSTEDAGYELPRSIKKFCHVVHSTNHVTKRPNPLPDKISVMILQTCCKSNEIIDC